MYKETKIPWKILCFSLLLFRIVLMWLVPVLDKTEARYAEIARLMYETGDWVVPQIQSGVPFWAKPPLSTWGSALSYTVFGVDEFTARLPSLLITLILFWAVAKIAREKGISGYVPIFVLLTLPEFLIHIGVVSTDMTLVLAVSLIMIAFWKSMISEGKSIWRYLFFVGIGIGLLAKGPICLVLTLPSILGWCLLDRSRMLLIWKKLPWFLGSLIALGIALPWYLLAEQQSPGFLEYFIVGEHFKRYTDSGWKGDKYGFAKTQPLGMIWVFLIGFAFPWIQMLGHALWKDRRRIVTDPWISYLVLWLLWTPFFFMLSKNALHTYILPITIPIALLVTTYWNRYSKKKLMMGIAMVFPIVACIAFIGLQLSGTFEDNMNTDKYMIATAAQIKKKGTPIYYWKKETYSSQFYTQGSILPIVNIKELDEALQTHERIFICIPKKRVHEIPLTYRKQFTHIAANRKAILYWVSL